MNINDSIERAIKKIESIFKEQSVWELCFLFPQFSQKLTVLSDLIDLFMP